MKNKLTVVIATRPNIKNIQWIFHSLDIQTFQDFKIILLIDKNLQKDEFEKLKKESLVLLQNIKYKIAFVSNINTDFVPQSGVSYVRNYGIKLADTEFINLFDDDELFEPDYIQKSFDIRLDKKGELKKDFLLVPTLMFRKTWKIQSQWFDYYNFWTSRPHSIKLNKWQKLAQIQMYSGNSLFGPTKIFQEILFDERLDFVYEDLEFTYRVHKNWYPIFVSSELLLFHMERDKNILEHAWVWNKFSAYRKAKHRMIFVKKNWTLSDKIKFYIFWFRMQPLWLIFKVILNSKPSKTFWLIFAIIRGTCDGLFS